MYNYRKDERVDYEREELDNYNERINNILEKEKDRNEEERIIDQLKISLS